MPDVTQLLDAAAAEIAQAERAGFKVHPELKRAVSNALD